MWLKDLLKKIGPLRMGAEQSIARFHIADATSGYPHVRFARECQAWMSGELEFSTAATKGAAPGVLYFISMNTKKHIKKAATAAKPYKIDKGLKVTEPIQSSGMGLPGRTAVTLKLLEAGDSFLIKDALEAMRAEKQVRDFASRERKSGGKREFTVRRVKDGTRIWRTR